MITELEFKSRAAQGYNRIPLIAEAFADLETPLSLYLKLAGGSRHSFLLESVVGGERFSAHGAVQVGVHDHGAARRAFRARQRSGQLFPGQFAGDEHSEHRALGLPPTEADDEPGGQ